MTRQAGMLKRWRFREPAPTQANDADRFAKELAVDPLVARLLLSRGVGDRASARAFLSPKLTDLDDPQLVPGLDRAARRLEQAVRAGQPIVIYSDYDVDGITAGAILWHVLTQAGARVSIYVPHRIDEGYGLNCEAIARLCQADPKPLIVSVDCGITAVEPAKAARAAGVDLIITDHHEFDPSPLPDAAAIVHPHAPPTAEGQESGVRGQESGVRGQESGVRSQESDGRLATDAGSAEPTTRNAKCETRNAVSLCGAGVAFKLAWHFARLHCGSERLPADFKALLLDCVSLAALGTVADVVPLVGENRVLTVFGLGQIKRTRFVGLNALIDASRLRDEKIDSYHVGFVLGPRLNACGRMGHAGEAVKLLTDARPDEADRMAQFLSAENDRRRGTEREIFEEARRMVAEAGYDRPDCRAIVLGKEGWHPGVVGIVASRLVEQFARPVVLLNFAGDQAQGSARSIDGLSIHAAFTHCAAHLTSFGGHAMAAGLKLTVGQVEAFRKMMVAYANDRISPDDLTSVLDIDAECGLERFTLELCQAVQKLAPFGRGNPAPVVVVRQATLAQPVVRMGAGGQHLRLALRQGERVMWAVWFGAGEHAEQLVPGVRLDVAVEPKVSVWQGARRVELFVKDVAVGT